MPEKEKDNDIEKQNNNEKHNNKNNDVANFIFYNSNDNLLNNTFQLFGKQDVIETHGQIIFAEKATLSKLIVKVTAPPGNGNSRTFTIRINGHDTNISVNISNNAVVGINNNIKLKINEGDLISLIHRSTNTNVLTPAIGIATLEYHLN